MEYTEVLTKLVMRVQEHLDKIYTNNENCSLAYQLVETLKLLHCAQEHPPFVNHWDEQDVLLVTYGDSIREEDEKPLDTLFEFLDWQLKDTLSAVHLLPFFPYSSDDGFSIIEYCQVNDSLGDWGHIEKFSAQYTLMADVVINHMSSRSQWFEKFKRNEVPYNQYFYTADPNADLSAVVRPRTSPLLRAVETSKGEQHVWCTFSHDQVDLDFSNPRVLVEFVNIIRFYLDRGIKWFRLDAVAFLWKEVGTNCIHLPQTHELIRLLRTLIEYRDPAAVVITETNVPNHENLSYFGNANEAHVIYNFSLPPLLLNTMVTGNSRHLKTWMMSMPPPRNGTAYLNFIASHDGIGLRPAEGLFSEDELNQLIQTMRLFGGRITTRALSHHQSKPYEINISLFDAMQGTVHHGPDKWQLSRFICAHVIMMGLEGIPAFYIHSLLATSNDYDKLEHTGHNRSINRHRWDKTTLYRLLNDDSSRQFQILSELKRLIGIRKQQAAFHPNATQFTLHLGEQIFGFWRQSIGREQSVFCVSNISDQHQAFSLSDLNLTSTEKWTDLIGGGIYDDHHADVELIPYQSVWLTNTISPS